MRPTAILAALACTATLVAGTVTTALAAAPGDPVPPGPDAPHPGGLMAGDRDGDRVSDNFEAELAAAGPADRFDVIVEGVRPGPARNRVGAFDLGFDLPIIDGFSATMTAAQVRGLLHAPGLTRVSEDGVVRALDDAGNRDFGVDAARADNQVDAATVLDGRGVGICVVDTGILAGHEQVVGRVAGFFDAINGRTVAYDDHGHGTHVAGIALGDGTALEGASGTAQATAARAQGVAPAATLYAAKVLNSQGSGQTSQVLAGINWCVQRKDASPPVRVISMSLGDAAATGGTDPMTEAVDNAVAAGLAVVVAAGNSGDAPYSINSPGFAPSAITVGAVADWSAQTTAPSDAGIWLAGFSSRGPVSGTNAVKPDISAPGVSVLSATKTSTSSYASWNGTSMATPFVAGAAALALQADPATTPQQLKAAIMSTAVDRGPQGTDNDWGAGLIDVRALVDAVEDLGAPSQTLVRTGFPVWQTWERNVAPHGWTDVPITIPPEGLGVPLALTMTITSGNCGLCAWFGPLFGEWSPDLDMELRTPEGRSLAVSECTLGGLSCGIGRQETIGFRPTQTDYTVRVYEWTEGDRVGGSILLELSRGPQAAGFAPAFDDHKAAAGSGSAPPTNPPAPVVPEASISVDKNPCPAGTGRKAKCTFTLDGRASHDPDNGTDPGAGIVGWQWKLGTKVVGDASTLTQMKGVGNFTYRLTVTDDDGQTRFAEKTVQVTSTTP